MNRTFNLELIEAVEEYWDDTSGYKSWSEWDERFDNILIWNRALVESGYYQIGN